MWSILYTIPSGIIVFLAHLTFNWFRAPGKLDEQLRDEFEKVIQKVRKDASDLERQRQTETETLRDKNERLRQSVENFEKRLRPNIWITGKSYENALVTREYLGEMGVGFSVENKSDKALHDVCVELVKIEEGFLTKDSYIQFANEGGRGRIEDRATYVDRKELGEADINLPIMLEWSPQQQHRQGVSSTTIPAGTERVIGLFSSQTILTADYQVRGYLSVSSMFVYRIAIRLSARGIPAITSADYVISRINKSEFAVADRDIRYEVFPAGPVQLVSPCAGIEL